MKTNILTAITNVYSCKWDSAINTKDGKILCRVPDCVNCGAFTIEISDGSPLIISTYNNDWVENEPLPNTGEFILNSGIAYYAMVNDNKIIERLSESCLNGTVGIVRKKYVALDKKPIKSNRDRVFNKESVWTYDGWNTRDVESKWRILNN